MRGWLKFVVSNKRLLNFGFLFNFFSSFGQTFFISLFVPFWVESLGITNATFGSIYATVTIISAILLSLTGRFIDRMPLSRFSLIVFVGLILSVLLLARANSMLLLIIGLLLVRWFGQGLMAHTSSTGIAKKFGDNRGKALGVTALGHPAGQLFLPIVVLPLVTLVGWRLGLTYISVAALLIVIPSLWAMSPVIGGRSESCSANARTVEENASNPFASVKFWILAVNIFIIPFLCTAIFLYQYSIGQSKGWDPSWVAFSFAFYAVFNAIALILSGTLVDRFSGLKLFPLYLIPALLALVAMPVFTSKWVFPLFYALLGVSTGLGSTIKTAIQAEVYGISNLGKIRSYFSTILVVSTALGAPIFGFLLDRQISFSYIFLASGLAVLLIILLSFRLGKTRSWVSLLSLPWKLAWERVR